VTEMSPAEDVFFTALAKADPAERAAYLDEACGADVELRRHVGRLLEAHPQIGSFLEEGAEVVPEPHKIDGPAGATIDLPIVTEHAGTVIGPYKLLQQIGEGGFGVVFMAEQSHPVKRKIALKVIKPGMDSRQVIARFEAERQALAMMDHVNIARVFDGGTTENGRPYFVMELVHGVPITKYCDDNNLTPRERLELIVPVCQAIQHAHQKGIIHRDLKPSNVLVALYDGKPVPKVIDFGVAKATGTPLTEETVHTGFGAVVGTVEYMSPEQASFNQLDVDTRSDIYSLGVLVYELLVGSPPFSRKELEKAGPLEMLRFIRELEPTRPSTKLGTSEGLLTLAANRGTEPAKLARLLRGELDWIVMKALEKDRNRRYDTANALAADLQRYLHDEPVLACPPSAWYRFRKFTRRNKPVMAMAGVVVLAAFLALGSFAVSYLRIQESLQQERKAKQDLVQGLYYQRIASAASARATGQAGRAEELLELCPNELRGWEWHYLKRKPLADFPVFRHPGVITRVAVSRDGHLLASGNSTGTVKIWDTQTKAKLHELEKHGRFIRALAFSPDGRLLATGSENEDSGIVKIWNPATGKELMDLPGHASALTALTFSPDGRFLATACQNDCVRVWDMANGKAFCRIQEPMVAFNGLAFCAEGRCILTASMEGIVKTFDATTGEMKSSFQGNIQWVFSAAFSRDRQRVALGSEEGTIKVWETEYGQEIHKLEAHTGLVMDLVFLADDQRLASCGDDRTLKIWDLTTGHEALQLGVFAKRSQALAVSADGLRLFYRHVEGAMEDAIGVADGTPLTDHVTDRRTKVLSGHLHNVVALCWSRGGQRLASASWDQTAKVWDTTTGREQFTLRGHEAALTDVTFSHDDQLIASASWDETVRVWDTRTGQELFKFRSTRGPVHGVAFHPKDSHLLASAHHDGTIKLWDPITGQPRKCDIKAEKHPVLGVAFSPDGEFLVSANGKADKHIKIWSTSTGEMLHALEQKRPGICSSAVFHPNGQFVAGVASTNDVCLWDVATGKICSTLPHPLRPNRVALSPDGCRLATVSLDQTVRLWDVPPLLNHGLQTVPQEPVEIRGHVGDVWCAAFSPDGRLATGAGYNGRGEIRIREAVLQAKKP
jgi:eukaryotic-like serine/threonine-protein kinase